MIQWLFLKTSTNLLTQWIKDFDKMINRNTNDDTFQNQSQSITHNNRKREKKKIIESILHYYRMLNVRNDANTQ